jgi:RsiW-degrading membrane proteinase PrsW (M82 family)
MYPLLIFVAVLPGLLISYLIFRLDRYEKEPRLALLICFGLGVVVTVPAMYLEHLFADLGWDAPTNFWLTLAFSFIGIALVEELFKFLAVLIYPFGRRPFNEPIDGIVYTVMIGMGFATLENVLYADRFGLETLLVRSLTAVPAHAAFAVVMGYYVGWAKFRLLERKSLLAKGFLLTVALHGAYDFFILQELYSWLILLAIIILGVSIYLSRRLILEHQESSPFRTEESD